MKKANIFISSVQVMLFRNRLEIWNPGRLPYGLTIQQLYKPHRSLPNNPLLAEPMYWNGYIEKIGSGTEDIIQRCKSYGLREPDFEQDCDFKVTIWRPVNADSIVKDSTTEKTTTNVPQNARHSKLITIINQNNSISKEELASQLNVTVMTIKRDLKALGIIWEGASKTGHWVFTHSSDDENMLKAPTMADTGK